MSDDLEESSLRDRWAVFHVHLMESDARRNVHMIDFYRGHTIVNVVSRQHSRQPLACLAICPS